MTQLEVFEQFILPDQQIRISTFDKVNDPFELLGAISGGKQAHRDFSWLKQFWSETQGFISFSDNWGSPLMWAHYGANHTGVCLGIDIPDAKVLKMDYQPKRSALEFDFQRFENATDMDLLKSIVSTKFSEWSYEREWRIMLPLQYDPREPRPSFFYEQFTPDFELREVIVGAKCAKSVQQLASVIPPSTATIQVKAARAAFADFRIVHQHLVPSVQVQPVGDFTKKERNQLAQKRRSAASAADKELRKASSNLRTKTSAVKATSQEGQAPG